MHSLLFFSVIHRKSHPAIVFGGEMNTQNDYLKYSIQWWMKIIICSSCYLFSSFWSASLPWSYVRFHTNSSPYKWFIKYIWSFFIVFMKSPTEIHAVEIPRSPLEFHRRLVQHKAKHFFRDFFRPFYIQALKKPLFKGLTYFMVPVPRIELSAEHYHCSVLPLYYTGRYALWLESYYIIIGIADFFNHKTKFFSFFPDTLSGVGKLQQSAAP